MSDFNKTNVLFGCQKYTSASNRYRQLGKTLMTLLKQLEYDIGIESKLGERNDYSVIGGGVSGVGRQQHVSRQAMDWVKHNNEETGEHSWYSAETKQTQHHQPQETRALEMPISKLQVLQTPPTPPPPPPPTTTTAPTTLTTGSKKNRLGLEYWGARINCSEPLGHHMEKMPYVDIHLIGYQLGQMAMKDGKAIVNPILHLMTSFGCHVKTLAVRCMANSGAARDKTDLFVGAQRAYQDALALLTPTTISTTATTATATNISTGLVPFNRKSMVGMVRRHSVTSMQHHIHSLLQSSIQWIATGNYNKAIVSLR